MLLPRIFRATARAVVFSRAPALGLAVGSLSVSSATAALAANDRRPASSRPLLQWALKKLCEIKREVVRIRKRKWLTEATYVSLASDDRQRYKLLKFKCDLGQAPPLALTELGARHGLIGVCLLYTSPSPRDS